MILGGARTAMAEYSGTPGFGKFKDITAIAANSRALVRLTPPPAPAAPTAGVVDFGTDSGAPLDAPLAGPPVVKHGSILPARFRAGLRSRP